MEENKENEDEKNNKKEEEKNKNSKKWGYRTMGKINIKIK